MILILTFLTAQLTQRRPLREEGPACIEKCMDDIGGIKTSNGEIMLAPFDDRRLSQNHDISDGKTLSETCNGGRREFIAKQLKSISTNLQHLVDHHRDMDNEAEVLDEWKLLATAIDRLCLYAFLCGSIILFTILGMELIRRGGESENTTIEASLDDRRYVQIGR